MRKRLLALVALAAVGVTSPLLAQQHKQPSMPSGASMVAMHCGGDMEAMMKGMGQGMAAMHGDSMKPGMMGNMNMSGMMDMMGPPSPAMILHHTKDLGLTAAQIARLQALQKQAQPACTQHMQLGMAAHTAANQLLEAASPNFTAYNAKLKEATAHMVEGQVAMARAAVAARDVLTAAQRQKLKNQMEQMHKTP